MIVYSSLLALALALSSPWWLWQMATSGRYRAGLAGRLGVLPRSLDDAIRQRSAAAGLIWLHAVSVGEVVAAQRLIAELQAALPAHLLVVSTTTETGQQIARDKFGGVPVFFYPLDFRFAVRRYLRALRPTLFVTVESEFWPRMLVECDRAKIPVAVVNARISDRSFPRYLRLRRLWQPFLAKVSLFLTSGNETSSRLLALGVLPRNIELAGNLKYDLVDVQPNPVVDLIRIAAGKRKIVIAGSTVASKSWREEDLVLQAMNKVWEVSPDVLLILAPRHPDRFDYAVSIAAEHGVTRVSDLLNGKPLSSLGRQSIVLDTLGDLASLYQVADVAFIGGSLVPRGGHNPLEAARFAVPIVMGPSYENFREIVSALRSRQAIQILPSNSNEKDPPDAHEALAQALRSLLSNDEGMGKRALEVFEEQTGATQRTVEALTGLLQVDA